jgi:hypothetical protein
MNIKPRLKISTFLPYGRMRIFCGKSNPDRPFVFERWFLFDIPKSLMIGVMIPGLYNNIRRYGLRGVLLPKGILVNFDFESR